MDNHSRVWCRVISMANAFALILHSNANRAGILRGIHKVSLLIVDPENTGRYMEIRGEAELIFEHAVENLDKLTRKYTCHPQYYGYIYPLEQQARETRVIDRIHPMKITLDTIHK